MIDACRCLGAHITQSPSTLVVQGSRHWQKHLALSKNTKIFVGNSGQVLRWITALCALSPFPVEIDGDDSLRQQRSMKELLDTLSHEGATVQYLGQTGFAPFRIHGLKSDRPLFFQLPGQDSQPLSALLTLACFLDFPTHIDVKDPGEIPWTQLTLSWFQKLGLSYQQEHFQHFDIPPQQSYLPFQYTVPGDWSSAAFPIVSALLTHSSLTLFPLDTQDPQGDKALIPLLEDIGASFDYCEKTQTLSIRPSGPLKGFSVDINPLIDALPILATLACFCTSPSRIYNGAVARRKECDRIAVICQELRKMGAHMDEQEDGLSIQPSSLKGATVKSHSDHRIALSLAIAGLTVGHTDIQGSSCITKSYPSFIKDFCSIGAHIDGE
jgi:3-phosphoshikimate 1-carboxyvinyltransferase